MANEDWKIEPIGPFLEELDPGDKSRLMSVLKDACGTYWVSDEVAYYVTKGYALAVLEAVADHVAGDSADALRRVLTKARAEWTTS